MIDRMSSTLRALQNLVIGGLGAALFVVTLSGQAGSPSEANHFIATPKGWSHPKTAWGDPDLTGMWPVSFVGTVPLERCKGGFARPGGPPPPPCDTSTNASANRRINRPVDSTRTY